MEYLEVGLNTVDIISIIRKCLQHGQSRGEEGSWAASLSVHPT